MKEPTIEKEILSDGSAVFNVHIPEQTINCRDEKHANWLVVELKATTAIAGSMAV